MIAANQWAQQLLAAQRLAVKDQAIETAFLHRAEEIARQAQLDTIRQCLRLAHRQMNEARPVHRVSLGKLIDALADLALDVEQRRRPVKGDG